MANLQLTMTQISELKPAFVQSDLVYLHHPKEPISVEIQYDNSKFNGTILYTVDGKENSESDWKILTDDQVNSQHGKEILQLANKHYNLTDNSKHLGKEVIQRPLSFSELEEMELLEVNKEFVQWIHPNKNTFIEIQFDKHKFNGQFVYTRNYLNPTYVPFNVLSYHGLRRIKNKQFVDKSINIYNDIIEPDENNKSMTTVNLDNIVRILNNNIVNLDNIVTMVNNNDIRIFDDEKSFVKWYYLDAEDELLSDMVKIVADNKTWTIEDMGARRLKNNKILFVFE